MHPFNDYSVYIFDCDGVILDANEMKIKAMRAALEDNAFITGGIEASIAYFTGNFGKSRFHHARKFVADFLECHTQQQDAVAEMIVKDYANMVSQAYQDAPLLDDFMPMLENLEGVCFVASGSEQKQLREVFANKKLSRFFRAIYGSPKSKIEIIKEITEQYRGEKICMIGDAIADLEAANAARIDFLGVLDKSNVPDLLQQACEKNGYPYILNWNELS